MTDSTQSSGQVPGPGTQAGDDVIVTVPSGREINGRIACWIGGRADVLLIDEWRPHGFREVKNYPKSWIKAWEA